MRFHSVLSIVGLSFLAECSAATVMKRDLTTSSDLPDGYTYLGCYIDSPQARQLTGASYTDASGMTEESCISFCSSKGFEEAGLEYSSECYCGHQFTDPPNQVSDSDCNMPCSGDSTEACGAGNRLSVFSNGKAAPTTNPGTNGFSLIGCFSDSPSARTLSIAMGTGSSGVTVPSCISTCSDAGYTYAGVENGNECYCDTAVRNGASIESGCTVTCSGDSTEYCGGSFQVDVYENFDATPPAPAPIPTGWSSVGCYNDNVSARTLANRESVAGGDSKMTVEACLSSCQSAGYQYAGVEYSTECYCDNTIENGATPASDPSTCHYPCAGNPGETCGGSSVLNVYSYTSASRLL